MQMHSRNVGHEQGQVDREGVDSDPSCTVGRCPNKTPW